LNGTSSIYSQNRNQDHIPIQNFQTFAIFTPGGYKGGIHEYERLIKAAKWDKEAAIKSCSWGAFQVLAEYHKEMGYLTASIFANECMVSIDAQIKLFIDFLTKLPEKKPAIKALKEKDWETFTSNYNGRAWRKTNADYPTKMANHYVQFKKT
jgi:hypothetical protein